MSDTYWFDINSFYPPHGEIVRVKRHNGMVTIAVFLRNVKVDTKLDLPFRNGVFEMVDGVKFYRQGFYDKYFIDNGLLVLIPERDIKEIKVKFMKK